MMESAPNSYLARRFVRFRPRKALTVTYGLRRGGFNGLARRHGLKGGVTDWRPDPA